METGAEGIIGGRSVPPDLIDDVGHSFVQGYIDFVFAKHFRSSISSNVFPFLFIFSDVVDLFIEILINDTDDGAPSTSRIERQNDKLSPDTL